MRESRLLDYLRLMRVPNVFTALADVAMGFLVARGHWQPMAGLICLLLASSLLYLAGMVLNDVCDLEQDRRERPQRPIPSGRIALPEARRLGLALLAAGVLLGWLAAGLWHGPQGMAGWRSGWVITLLAMLVWAYDWRLKSTFLGPAAMGGCRLLNVLLGASLGGPAVASILGFGAAEWVAAGGIGVYVMGVTWLARTEARASHRGWLGLGSVTILAGVLLLATLPRYLPPPVVGPVWHRDSIWLILLIALAYPILRRCLSALVYPTPARVQAAVKLAILSIILMDAAVALRAGPPLAALAILGLLLPAMLLGHWVYST